MSSWILVEFLTRLRNSANAFFSFFLYGYYKILSYICNTPFEEYFSREQLSSWFRLCEFNIIPIKIPLGFRESWQADSKMYMKEQRIRRDKTLKKKNQEFQLQLSR